MAAQKIIKAKSTAKEYYKFLGLLMLLALTATLMSTLISFHVADWLRWFIGSFFVLFGGFKLIGYESFVAIFPKYDLLTQKYPKYAYVYPFVELILGGMFILDMASILRNIITIGLLIAGLYSLLNELPKRGPSVHATMLGGTFKLPLTTTLLFEDILLLVMMILLVIASIMKV